jgi:hypothetical protein
MVRGVIVKDGSNDYYFAWGDDIFGQLCDSTSGNTYPTPEYVPFRLTGLKQPLSEVSSGGTTGYLLDHKGTVSWATARPTVNP